MQFRTVWNASFNPAARWTHRRLSQRKSGGGEVVLHSALAALMAVTANYVRISKEIREFRSSSLLNLEFSVFAVA